MLLLPLATLLALAATALTEGIQCPPATSSPVEAFDPARFAESWDIILKTDEPGKHVTYTASDAEGDTMEVDGTPFELVNKNQLKTTIDVEEYLFVEYKTFLGADYNSWAAFYTCFYMESSGERLADSSYVEILGRTESRGEVKLNEAKREARDMLEKMGVESTTVVGYNRLVTNE